MYIRENSFGVIRTVGYKKGWRQCGDINFRLGNLTEENVVSVL